MEYRMSTLELKELSHPSGEVIKIAAGKTLDLKSQGTTTLPTGSVIQVANLVIDTETASAATTFVAAGGTDIAFSALASTSSKVLVKYSIVISSQKGSNTGVKLYRSIGGAAFAEVTGPTSTRGTGNAYNVWLTNGYNPDNTHEDFTIETFSGEYLDSPNTTSSVTYKLYFRSRGSATSYIGRATNHYQNDNQSPRSTSSATLMEVSA